MTQVNQQSRTQSMISSDYSTGTLSIKGNLDRTVTKKIRMPLKVSSHINACTEAAASTHRSVWKTVSHKLHPIHQMRVIS